MKRLALAMSALAILAGAGCGTQSAQPAATTAPAPTLETLRIIFPEGFNIREMGDRVAAVRRIAILKRHLKPTLTRARYLVAANGARPPARFRRDWKRGSMEGFLFPALYDFTQYTTGNELIADQLTAFRKAFARVEPLVRPVEEPDALRRAQDRLDDREGNGGAAANGSSSPR